MNTKFDWRDMLHFDKMISPTFLTILYYIHVVVFELICLYWINDGMDGYMGGYKVMGGLIMLIVGPFLIRLLYELLIVIFKIHTRLTSIDFTLKGQNNPIVSPFKADSSDHNQHINPATAVPGVRPVTEPVTMQTSAPYQPVSAPIDLPDFWATQRPQQPLGNPQGSSTPSAKIDFNDISGKIPNWPAVVASVLILYGIVTPYASITPDLPIVGSLFGSVLGNSFSIKNSPLGIVSILGALAMIITSAGGLKWLWFIVGYSITALTAVLALISDNSLFSQISKIKSGISGTMHSTLGQFIPEADRLSNQMVQNVPGASQFLNASFYVFLLAILFSGYWALAGKYHEKGFINNA